MGIEIKAPGKSIKTKRKGQLLQLYTLRELELAGGLCGSLESYDEADQLTKFISWLCGTGGLTASEDLIRAKFPLSLPKLPEALEAALYQEKLPSPQSGALRRGTIQQKHQAWPNDHLR